VLVRTRHTEIVRKAFGLFEAGKVDALMALYHPRAEVRVTGALQPPARTYAGIEPVRSYLREVVVNGRNCRVDDLELLEMGDTVIASGRMAEPAHLEMRWQFDFEDDLIARVIPLEGDWAVLGGREFIPGQVGAEPLAGRVELRLGDGRSLLAPIAPVLEHCAGVHDPVLAYFDEGRLSGWYLPERRLGMDLR
jgi:ketosteroid isomerase-like protein